MGELIDRSVKRAVSEFLATPLPPEAEAAPGNSPFTHEYFAKKVVGELDNIGRLALFLEMLEDPEKFEIDSYSSGAETTADIVTLMCEVFIGVKANSFPDVAERDHEQWDTFYKVYPDQA